jgi:flavin reductase (DIM6/NTAB) family NADH-FMN oxidoreductase RutF
MGSHYRAKFINSLSGFKSVNLIGTQDLNGQGNVAIFSSVVHLGASPALVGFVMRPDNGSRHTLDNIINVGHYTINQVSADLYHSAHQSSANYKKDQSEFTELGLSPHYTGNIKAPFVKESRLKYAVQLKEIIQIPLNNTKFIIGEITHVICDSTVIKDDGYIDIEAIETVTVSGLDSYHKSERLTRLSHANTESLAKDLSINGTVKYNAETGNKN